MKHKNQFYDKNVFLCVLFRMPLSRGWWWESNVLYVLWANKECEKFLRCVGIKHSTTVRYLAEFHRPLHPKDILVEYIYIYLIYMKCKIWMALRRCMFAIWMFICNGVMECWIRNYVHTMNTIYINDINRHKW